MLAPAIRWDSAIRPTRAGSTPALCATHTRRILEQKMAITKEQVLAMSAKYPFTNIPDGPGCSDDAPGGYQKFMQALKGGLHLDASLLPVAH